MNAMPLIIIAIVFFALAYRFYFSFIAVKVAVINDEKITPSIRLYDGQNFYPMSKWVLFGHHFAAIAGAGPLVGPVLAAQFGFMPGFIWLLVGAVMAGAVLPATTLAQKYLVDLSVLGLGTDANTLVTTAAYLEVGIAVEKTTGLCGMYVIVDDYQYGTESTPAFTGTESIYNTTTNVTCVASDAYSKLMITIGPGADATHAIVTIMDTYNGQFFMQMSSFAINPQVN